MPRKDRTGPQGQGPKTGRGLGKCSSTGGSPVPQGQDGIGTGRGQGRGSGQKRPRSRAGPRQAVVTY